MDYLRRRRLKKAAHELLRHACHLRNMRGDILDPTQLEQLSRREAALRGALESRNLDAVAQTSESLAGELDTLIGRRSCPGLRDNIEIIIVAVAVAMACRTYFLQPFKIPTGSMQPTLYGITSVEQSSPRLTDRYPVKLAKWLVTGEWHKTVRAKASGILVDAVEGRQQTPSYVVIAGRPHKVPRYAVLNFNNGEYVAKGAVLWSGVTTAGDHVFVDKVRWNFFAPKRGQIMVFSTGAIPTLPPGTHYIKRLSGLPNETVSIDPPNLIIDGHPVRRPAAIARIADQEPGSGYSGYRLVNRDPSGLLQTPLHYLQLGPDQFFALGDNTTNSRDGRYWGSVPRQNLVGPAMLVYWPFSSRWGLAR